MGANGAGINGDSTQLPLPVKIAKGVNKWAQKNFFLAGLFVVLGLAKTFPSMGVNGSFLRPELTVGKYGVGLIFLLSGLSLQGSELTKAVANMKLNGLIQIAIFAAWPFLVGSPLKQVLNAFSVLPPGLVDGLLILTCLPTTVNMCIMLTSACNGNVAASICNAVISNMAGIFITPALLLHFFGTSIQLPFLQMVKKLCQKVLLPVAIGQALRVTKAKELYENNSKAFKRLQEIILLGIVWNAFCTAFTSGLGLQFHHTLILLTLLPVLHLGSMGILFKFFSIPALKFPREDVVAAIFCASQKTLAFGLPLINTIFEGNANLASYVAPLMFIHPLQMMLGSILVPRISKYTSQGKDKESS